MDDASALAVLQAIRLGAVLDEDWLATRLGLARGELAPRLERAVGQGWIRRHEPGADLPHGPRGWTLTADGRARLAVLLSDEVDRSGARSTFDALMPRFAPLNAAFLQLCTDWQVRSLSSGGSEPNDHRDRRYDRRVVTRLESTHADIVVIAGEAADALGRFGMYVPRFDHAITRVLAGEHDWFTRPLVDSYHTIWFEFHEDLLATTGRTRATPP